MCPHGFAGEPASCANSESRSNLRSHRLVRARKQAVRAWFLVVFRAVSVFDSIDWPFLAKYMLRRNALKDSKSLIELAKNAIKTRYFTAALPLSRPFSLRFASRSLIPEILWQLGVIPWRGAHRRIQLHSNTSLVINRVLHERQRREIVHVPPGPIRRLP